MPLQKRSRSRDGDGFSPKRRATSPRCSSFSAPTSEALFSSLKRLLDDDDTKQPEAKRPRHSPYEVRRDDIDVKSRLQLYDNLRRCQNWGEYCEILNAIPREYKFVLALAINDAPEELRLRALRELEFSRGVHYSRIVHEITEIQMKKSKFDPQSLFPPVATNEFVASLPTSAQTCSLCGGPFKVGYNMIPKWCGNHIMHERCAHRRVIERGEMPLWGPCDCVQPVH
jgi:hypothetical protein